MTIRSILLSLLVTLLGVGCRIEETITLQSDGSGKVHMEVTFPQLGMRWLPGRPSADWVRPNLPDGVRLTSFENTRRQTLFTATDGKEHEVVSEVYASEFSFDRIVALNDIRVRPDTRNATAAAAGATPGKEGEGGIAVGEHAGPDIGPFQKLTLIKDGDLLRFRRVVQAARDPDDIEASMMSAPGSSARPQVFDLGDAALKISIVCPGKVVEHNAHRVEGRTLTWEFKLQELQKRQDIDWIVRFACRREGES